MGGIGTEIHQDLMELRGVGQHGARLFVQLAAYRDGGRQGRAQQCERFGDQTRQPHGLAFLLALAAKGENLLYQVFGPAPRDADLLQVIPCWGGRWNTAQR
jgi:hypothetical protein